MTDLNSSEALSEMEKILVNYQIILTQVDQMDASHDHVYTQQLLNTIFNRYMPIIQNTAAEIKERLPNSSIHQSINMIEQMEKQYRPKNTHQPSITFSPLVLLLKLAVKVKSISFAQKQIPNQPEWGRFVSFRSYLQGLNFRSSTRRNGEYYPGLPSCILCFVPIWTTHEVVISASDDSFWWNDHLHQASHAMRKKQLQSWHDQCTAQIQARTQHLNEASKRLQKAYNGWLRSQPKTKRTYYDSMVQDCGIIPAHFPGMLATWTPGGKYKPSCFLDSCRFHTFRPPMADILDGIWTRIPTGGGQSEWTTPTKKIWGIDGCAEWAAFLQLASVSNNNIDVTDASLW